MSERQDDDLTPGRQEPQEEVDPRADAANTREQKVISDPLGLAGTPDPDAPSRRPRPRIVSLLGEFFKMSRTTAILLVTFVLVAILYSMVKDAPVLRVGPVGPPMTTSETEPATTTDPVTSPSPTEQVTGTTVPTTTTGPLPTVGTTGNPSPEGQQATTSAPGLPGTQTTGQQPQGTQPQPQQQPLQVPQETAVAPTGDGQTTE